MLSRAGRKHSLPQARLLWGPEPTKLYVEQPVADRVRVIVFWRLEYWLCFEALRARHHLLS